MTIADLAADAAFDPNWTGVCLHSDRKPWGPHSGRKGKTVAAARTMCRVAGCGVSYAPGGICGYCRELVRQKRRAMRCAS